MILTGFIQTGHRTDAIYGKKLDQTISFGIELDMCIHLIYAHNFSIKLVILLMLQDVPQLNLVLSLHSVDIGLVLLLDNQQTDKKTQPSFMLSLLLIFTHTLTKKLLKLFKF